MTGPDPGHIVDYIVGSVRMGMEVDGGQIADDSAWWILDIDQTDDAITAVLTDLSGEEYAAIRGTPLPPERTRSVTLTLRADPR